MSDQDDIAFGDEIIDRLQLQNLAQLLGCIPDTFAKRRFSDLVNLAEGVPYGNAKLVCQFAQDVCRKFVEVHQVDAITDLAILALESGWHQLNPLDSKTIEMLHDGVVTHLANATSRTIPMFNLLVTADETAWETDQLMRLSADRFKEYSGKESGAVSLSDPASLKALEGIPSFLMYELAVSNLNRDWVRYGELRDIRVAGTDLCFRFTEKGRFARSVILEWSSRLGIDSFEHNRTHWAIKDGGIPSILLEKLVLTKREYDVVYSFAGEDREYVERVARYTKEHGATVFYDMDEQADLWGKDLAEHLDDVYRQRARYCVMFISKHYAVKMWTKHERQSALARALQERSEYLLPVRFDNTEIPGIRPTVAFIDASKVMPDELGKLILQKLGRPLSDH